MGDRGSRNQPQGFPGHPVQALALIEYKEQALAPGAPQALVAGPPGHREHQGCLRKLGWVQVLWFHRTSQTGTSFRMPQAFLEHPGPTLKLTEHQKQVPALGTGTQGSLGRGWLQGTPGFLKEAGLGTSTAGPWDIPARNRPQDAPGLPGTPRTSWDTQARH